MTYDIHLVSKRPATLVTNSHIPTPGCNCSNAAGLHAPPIAANPFDSVRRPKLTQREIEVIVTWLRTDSKTIAGRRLFIAPSTVNTHISRVRYKYANVDRPANTKALLAIRLIQDGIVSVDDL